MIRVALLAVALLVVTSPALAEEPGAAAGARRGPKYVGDPFSVFVRAEGFAEDPQPECVPAKRPAGIQTMRFVGVSPQISSYFQLFNGKRTEERKVVFTYEYEVVATKPGAIRFEPFVVKQGATEVRTNAFSVSVLTVPVDETMTIALEVPPGPYAPGERVPVTLVWSFAGELRDARGVTIRSELFDVFNFDDEEITRNDLLLPLTTAQGIVKIKGAVEKVRIGGKPGVRVRATRTWLVEKAGTYDFAPITIQMQRVTQWRRTFFDREPAAVTQVRATGRPLSIVVEALPAQGRPKSFAGAVGRGFSLEASADRTVVRAGDPIRLTLTLRGDGNLRSAGLPPLTDGGGLDPANFRQADAEATGQVTDDAKVFEVTVRVEHDRVVRIPPIEYGWWNPKARVYETTQSKPIALQVGEAEVVTAEDVVSAGPKRDPATTDTTQPQRSAAQIASGADLALVEDVSRLRSTPGGPLVPIVLYVLSAGVIALAFASRKRAQVDPAIRERRHAASRAAAAIGKAKGMAPAEGAKHAAETLRTLRAAHPDVVRPADYDDVLAKLDAIAYRPAADGALPAELIEAARSVAEELGR